VSEIQPITPDIPQEWLEEFEAASKRTLEERFRYSFIKTYKPVMDDARYALSTPPPTIAVGVKKTFPAGWDTGALNSS
jgi:hypothetical protein